MACKCNDGDVNNKAVLVPYHGENFMDARLRHSHAAQLELAAQAPRYMGGMTSFKAAIEGEADRIRRLGNGCAQMFYSDYVACRGVDFATMCRRNAFMYTDDVLAKFQGVTSEPADAFRITGSAIEILRALDYLDTNERIGSITIDPPGTSLSESEISVDASRTLVWDADSHSYTTAFEGGDTPGVGAGVGVLVQLGAAKGVSGPSTAEVEFELYQWGYATADAVRTQFTVLGTGEAPSPPSIPAQRFRARITVGSESAFFIPFLRAVANKGRSVPAWYGSVPIQGLTLTDDGMGSYVLTNNIIQRVQIGGVKVHVGEDVFSSVRATLIGPGSTLLPEALALLAGGKEVRP